MNTKPAWREFLLVVYSDEQYTTSIQYTCTCACISIVASTVLSLMVSVLLLSMFCVYNYHNLHTWNCTCIHVCMYTCMHVFHYIYHVCVLKAFLIFCTKINHYTCKYMYHVPCLHCTCYCKYNYCTLYTCMYRSLIHTRIVKW